MLFWVCRMLFELLALAGAQVGSDWTTILKKRQSFRCDSCASRDHLKIYIYMYLNLSFLL